MNNDEHLLEWKDASEAVGRLAKDERDFTAAVEAFDKGDADGFRKVLERHKLLAHATRICFWLCTWRCVRIIRVVWRELPTAAPTADEFREFAQLVQPLAESPELLKRLVGSLDKGDARGFGAIIGELKLQRYGYFLAQWICSFRCRRFCLIIATPAAQRPNPLEELRESFEALAHLSRDAAAFGKALQLFERGDGAKFRDVLEGVSALRYCLIYCRWFCHWHCFRLCFVLCRTLPELDLTIPELREFGLALGHAAGDGDALKQLSSVMLKHDAKAWGPLLERLKLHRFCYYVCRWYCHLHCDRRCVIFCPPGCLSVFRYIGGYNVLSGINSSGAGNGLTTADARAFYSTIRLNGVLCKQHAGGPAEYRFEFRAPGSAVWAPVPTAMIDRTVIGQWQAPPLVAGDPIQVKPYTVKGAAPNDMVAAISADGWVQVPQESNVNLPAGNFAPNGNLINLDTTKLQAWTDLNLAGVAAGQSTAPATLGADEIYGLRLVVRRVGLPGTATVSGTCERVAIYNRHYDNVRHKGSWAPQDDDDQLGAALVNIDEIGTGCGKVANALTIRYTAAHPNLGTISVHMDGPGGPYTTTLADAAGATPPNRFGQATLVLPAGTTVADLKKCAYIVKLSVTILLTTGDGVPDPIGDEVAFCK